MGVGNPAAGCKEEGDLMRGQMSNTVDKLRASDCWNRVSHGRDVDLSNGIDFANTSKVHDWRNHVSYVVADLWNELSMESRMVAFIAAKDAADAEEWD